MGKSTALRSKRPGVKLTAPLCPHGALYKACLITSPVFLAAGEIASIRPLKWCLGVSGHLLGKPDSCDGLMFEGQMLIILKICFLIFNLEDLLLQ